MSTKLARINKSAYKTLFYRIIQQKYFGRILTRGLQGRSRINIIIEQMLISYIVCHTYSALKSSISSVLKRVGTLFVYILCLYIIFAIYIGRCRRVAPDLFATTDTVYLCALKRNYIVLLALNTYTCFVFNCHTNKLVPYIP